MLPSALADCVERGIFFKSDGWKSFGENESSLYP